MKRSQLFRYIMMLVAASFTAPAFSQSSQHALYNYRNDGDFNAWLNKDVEKITFSRIDPLGVEHDDIVVQEVWTSDSVFRIPLEAIDSIGFRAPAPEYQDNVFHVTVQHLPYVTNVDQLSITFSSNLPANMRPQVGMVITSDTFEEPLSNGFAGKIIDIIEDGSSLNVICETATVTDVFKKLVLVGNAQAVDKEEARSRPLRTTTRGFFDEYEEGNQTEFELPGKFTFKVNDFMSISDELKISADYYIYVDLPKFKLRATVTGTHNLETSLSIDSDKVLEWLGYEKEKHEPEWGTAVWPIVNIPGVFNFGIRLGGFFAPSVKLSLTGSTPMTITQTLGVEYSNTDTWLIPVVTPIVKAHSELGTPDITLSLEGKLFAGIALGLKTTLIGDNVLCGDVTGRFGPEFDANIQMKQKLGEDDHFNLYSLMKDSKIGVQLKADVKVKASVFGENLTDNLEWDWKWPIPDWEESRYLFPDFTKPELPYWAMSDPLSMYSKPSRDIIMPVQLGIGLFDKDGVKQKEYYCDDWYLLENENKDIPKVYLGDMHPGTTYTCRPMFNFLGLGEIVADPRTTFTVPNPVSLEFPSLNIMNGDSKDVEIVGGWGNYKIVNSDDNIAIASFNNSNNESEDNLTDDNNLIWSSEGTPSMHIIGIGRGGTTIDVIDLRSNETTSINVVVTDENTTPLQLSSASLSLSVHKQGSVNITSGSGNYTAESSNSDVATVAVSDGSIMVTAIAVGAATITVIDKETELTATIKVVVTEDGIDEPVAQSTISIDTEEINFGNVFVGNSKTKQFKVSNTGEHNLTFSVSETHGEFEIAESGKEFTLGPKEEKTFDVIYTPAKEETSSNGTITITSDAENNSSWTITLTGTGRSKGSVNLSVGLVAYYPFIGNADDVTGNGNNGTPKTNVTLTTGVEGDENGAYQFGGYSSPGHIYIPNSESLKFSEGVSFSAYIKPLSWVSMDGWGSRTSSGGLQCIMAKDHDRYGISLAFSGNDNGCRFWTHNMCNQKWSEISSGDQLKGNYLNKWTHVAYVYGDGYARLYVDGQLMDEREATPDFSTINSRDLYIGKFSDSWYPFNGVIDEVRIYNRTLTPAEVEKLAVFHEDL